MVTEPPVKCGEPSRACEPFLAALSTMEEPSDHGVAAAIMVLSTADADAILKKSRLTVVDLFRPFGLVEDANSAHVPPHMS